jgi:hypothetical protein
MKLTLEMPQQKSNAPLLAFSVLLGMLLSPALEHYLDSWTSAAAATQKGPEQGTSTWDLRTMWH